MYTIHSPAYGETIMEHRNPSYYERKAQAALDRLAKLGPFVAATLVCVRHRCGNRRCKCASGEGHPSWRLTYKAAGQKTVTVYVPVGLLEDVREWVAQYRELKKLVAEISSAQIARVRLHVADARRRKTLR
jgi:hypothetical protein